MTPSITKDQKQKIHYALGQSLVQLDTWNSEVLYGKRKRGEPKRTPDELVKISNRNEAEMKAIHELIVAVDKWDTTD